jgi:hypothetical protein
MSNQQTSTPKPEQKKENLETVILKLTKNEKDDLYKLLNTTVYLRAEDDIFQQIKDVPDHIRKMFE